MQIYVVGGAVRDALLGRACDDRDYVVVGATPEAMVAKGFRPVGRDFPVFLHPETHEEYALARTERKSGQGYHGFTFHTATSVTLEEDLARRDLTINAMAQGDDGTLFDPFHGQQDLQAKILRHVSPAFAEDPVRILRLARFAARFADFTVAPETLALMHSMVTAGEVDFLVAERVWQELAKGMMEASPSRMFEVLRACGALARLLPEVDALFGVAQRAEFHPEIDAGVHTMMALDVSAQRGLSLAVRFAVLCHDLGKATTPADILPRHHGHEARSAVACQALSSRLKVPTDCRDLARLVASYHGQIHQGAILRAATMVKLFEETDVLRRPARFAEALSACHCDFNGRLGWSDKPYTVLARWQLALDAFLSVNAGAIARALPDKSTIPERVHQARVGAVKQALNELADQVENE